MFRIPAHEQKLPAACYSCWQKNYIISDSAFSMLHDQYVTVHGICDKISEIRTFLESEVFLNEKTLLIVIAKL